MHEKGHKGPFSEVGTSQRLRNQATRARGNQIGKTLKRNDQFKQYYGRDPKSGAVFLISHTKGQPARYKRVNMRKQGPSVNPTKGQRTGRDFSIAKKSSPTDSRRGREVLAGPKVNPNRKPEKKAEAPKATPKPKARPATPSKASGKSGRSSFQTAYAKARAAYKKGGKATFKFNDKTYTVATKEELKKSGGKYGKKLQAMLKTNQKKKPESVAT
jgi:hypothetical protein